MQSIAATKEITLGDMVESVLPKFRLFAENETYLYRKNREFFRYKAVNVYAVYMYDSTRTFSVQRSGFSGGMEHFRNVHENFQNSEMETYRMTYVHSMHTGDPSDKTLSDFIANSNYEPETQLYMLKSEVEKTPFPSKYHRVLEDYTIITPEEADFTYGEAFASNLSFAAEKGGMEAARPYMEELRPYLPSNNFLDTRLKSIMLVRGDEEFLAAVQQIFAEYFSHDPSEKNLKVSNLLEQVRRLLLEK